MWSAKGARARDVCIADLPQVTSSRKQTGCFAFQFALAHLAEIYIKWQVARRMQCRMGDLPGVCVKSLSVPSSSTAYLSCSQQVLERCRGSSPALIALSRDCFTSAALALLPPICQATQLSALTSYHQVTSAALQSILVWFSMQGLQYFLRGYRSFAYIQIYAQDYTLRNPDKTARQTANPDSVRSGLTSSNATGESAMVNASLSACSNRHLAFTVCMCF